MGAPCSHQRTWADYEFFERFHSTSRKLWMGSPRDFLLDFVALIHFMRLSTESRIRGRG
jgi:hypothetical protein